MTLYDGLLQSSCGLRSRVIAGQSPVVADKTVVGVEQEKHCVIGLRGPGIDLPYIAKPNEVAYKTCSVSCLSVVILRSNFRRLVSLGVQNTCLITHRHECGLAARFETRSVIVF